VAGSLVIVNPNASKSRDGDRRRALVEKLNVVLTRRDATAPRIVETRVQDETRPAVDAALAEGVGMVVGVGGDGTLRDIAASLSGTGVPLGVVPAGTANQLASVLGVPLSMEEAAVALETARPRTIDLGEVTLRLIGEPESTTIMTIGCGAGLDARIMATTPPGWKQRVGRWAYLVQGLKLVARLDVAPYRLTLDGRTIETDASIALVGNMGRLLPGILDLRLPIVPDDGLLDLIVVGARGPIQGIRVLADQLRRTSLGGGSGSDSLRLRGREITIEADSPLPLEVDGDYVGEGSLLARVMPGALDVMVPGDPS
jgi:diacylglycerol kinase family enzyme